jgi:gluconate 2-dehydrogenase gamma chain
MENHNKFSRRKFIKIASLGAGTLTLSVGGLRLIEGCSAPQRSAGNFLSDDEYHLIESIAEQIIPTDEWPGGRGAGIAKFIDIQLAGPYNRFQREYRKGLAAIEDTCLNKYASKFSELSWNVQTELLQDMEADKLSGNNWKDGFARKFFDLLRSHSLQGFYGSPRHGGNKDFASYKMIGLDVVQTVGQNRYGI